MSCRQFGIVNIEQVYRESVLIVSMLYIMQLSFSLMKLEVKGQVKKRSQSSYNLVVTGFSDFQLMTEATNDNFVTGWLNLLQHIHNYAPMSPICYH